MITKPVSNPALAKALTIGAGVALIVVGRFVPHELGFARDLISALGLLPVGVGSVQIVQRPKRDGA